MGFFPFFTTKRTGFVAGRAVSSAAHKEADRRRRIQWARADTESTIRANRIVPNVSVCMWSIRCNVSSTDYSTPQGAGVRTTHQCSVTFTCISFYTCNKHHVTRQMTVPLLLYHSAVLSTQGQGWKRMWHQKCSEGTLSTTLTTFC